MAEELVLDTAIRDWVLIPLSVVMVLIEVLRYFVSKLMRTTQSPDPKIVKEGQVIIRARNLRAATGFIPPKACRSRKVYYTNEIKVGGFVKMMLTIINRLAKKLTSSKEKTILGNYITDKQMKTFEQI